MVELPALGLEIVAARVIGHSLPAVVPNRAVAVHLEILARLARRRRRGVERVGEAFAVDRDLLMAAIDLGRRDTGEFQDRRRQVDDVVELVPDGAAVLDSLRPRDDQRIAHAAAMGVALVELQRRVRRLRPAPRIVLIALGPADLVDLGAVDGGAVGQTVEPAQHVDGALRSAIDRGAVVRDQHDQRVVVSARSPSGSRRRGRAAGRCSRGTPRTSPATAPPPASGRRRDHPSARRPDWTAAARRRRAQGPIAFCFASRRSRSDVPALVVAGRDTSPACAAAPGAGNARRRTRGRGRTACRGVSDVWLASMSIA